MRKKFIAIFLLISIFYIGINSGKCIEITDQSANVGVSGSGGGGESNVVNGVNGAEMQGIKVTVFRKDGKVVPGTSSKYIILKNGKYYTKNLCSCGNNYDFATTSKDSSCKCVTDANVDFITVDGITGTKYLDKNNVKNYWGLYFSNSPITSQMLTDSSYANIYKVLDTVGYNYNGGIYEEGDYLIVEPLVTVSCKDFDGDIFVSGTINSLIKADFSYSNGQKCGTYPKEREVTKKVPASGCYSYCSKYGQHGECLKSESHCNVPAHEEKVKETYYVDAKDMFIFYFNAIAQSYKIKGANCTTDTIGGRNIKNLNKSNYTGCGYNMYDLKDIVKHTCEVITDKNGKKVYYDSEGNSSDKDTNYVATCGCRTELDKNGKTIYYDNKGASTTEDNFRKVCTCATFSGKYLDDQGRIVDKNSYEKSCGCRKVTNDNGSITYYDRTAKVATKSKYEDVCLCYKEGNQYYTEFNKPVTQEEWNRVCNTSCEYRAQTTNMFDRVKLYHEYLNDADPKDYRNLLNLNLTGAAACTPGDDAKPFVEGSCMKITTTANFNEKNLSGYSMDLDSSQGELFCLTSMNLYPNITLSNRNVKSGMAYISGNSSDYIATSEVKLTCMLLGNKTQYTQEQLNESIKGITYNSIIKSLSYANRRLEYDLDTSSGIDIMSNSDGKVYFSKTFTAHYKYPKVYINKIDGEITNTYVNGAETAYGFFSNLNDKGLIQVPFEVTFGENAKGLFYKTKNGNNKYSYKDITTEVFRRTSSDCTYNATPELVNPSPRLEFRTVDSTRPFLGEDGNGRKVGANWCYEKSDGTYDCSSNNKTVVDVIINRNDSYNKQNTEPKYRIVLSPAVINDIRKYNKDVSIEDYKISCSENKCRNEFFNSISGSIIIGKNNLVLP